MLWLRENFVRPKIEDLVNTDAFCFQQDGATAYTVGYSRAVSQEIFAGHLISLRENITWLPRSPELSTCNYFLWGHLKAEVFKHRPKNIVELKDAIRQEISGIPLDILVRVMKNFWEWLHLVRNSTMQSFGRFNF